MVSWGCTHIFVSLHAKGMLIDIPFAPDPMRPRTCTGKLPVDLSTGLIGTQKMQEMAERAHNKEDVHPVR